MNRLKELRVKANITAVELAEKSGVKERTIRSYELGQRDIEKMSLGNAVKMADVLKCRAEDFIRERKK